LQLGVDLPQPTVKPLHAVYYLLLPDL
jgi:hypothetical protein